MDLSSLSNIILSLLTLTVLEIVLGVDNLIFISITCNRLPRHQQKPARRFGLLLAMITRLLLLASVVWLIGLTKPLFSFFDASFSLRDLILIGGGLFLLAKSTHEIHTEFEQTQADAPKGRFARFSTVIIQIAILDIVFSLDSVFTAV